MMLVGISSLSLDPSTKQLFFFLIFFPCVCVLARNNNSWVMKTQTTNNKHNVKVAGTDMGERGGQHRARRWVGSPELSQGRHDNLLPNGETPPLLAFPFFLSPLSFRFVFSDIPVGKPQNNQQTGSGGGPTDTGHWTHRTGVVGTARHGTPQHTHHTTLVVTKYEQRATGLTGTLGWLDRTDMTTTSG